MSDTVRTLLQEQGTTPVYAHLSEIVDDVLAIGLEPCDVLVIGRLVLVEKAAPTPPEPRASRDSGGAVGRAVRHGMELHQRARLVDQERARPTREGGGGRFAPTEAQIQAAIERDMADPEWMASIQRGRADARAGRFIPWRLAILPLPRWVFRVLFWVAPYTWGRKVRRG